MNINIWIERIRVASWCHLLTITKSPMLMCSINMSGSDCVAQVTAPGNVSLHKLCPQGAGQSSAE